jgi:O-methyltransferase
MGLLKYYAKSVLKPLIYRFPPIMIQPERLMLWHQTIIETAHVAGDVVEVGCYLGGTAAVSKKMMGNLGNKKPYRVYDTFDGFVKEQWSADYAGGAFSQSGSDFSSNSPELTRWILNKHGGEDVLIYKGDIATLPDSDLPASISACLLDVDLTEPIYLGLVRLYPKLRHGGTILVDDCNEGDWYKARIGYERFMKELGRSPQYKFGMGILTK